MDADAAGSPRNAFARRPLGLSNSKGQRRGSAARAIRSARPGSGRPNFRRCATRREPDAIGAASKSRADWADKSIVLVMEGVFHESVILVDEAPVAVHGDGWTPIEIDLTRRARRQDLVRARRRCAGPDDRNGGRFSQSLAAKQDWYGVQGGIWKSARLEARDPVHFAKRRRANLVRPQDGLVSVSGELSRAAADDSPRSRSRAAAKSRRAPHLSFRVGPIRRRSRFPRPSHGRRKRPTFTISSSSSSSATRLSTAIERSVGFRRSRRKTAVLPQRRALLHVRRARSGLASRGGLPRRRARSFSSSGSPTPRRWGSTRCAATSRFPTRSISISPTGSGSSSGSTCPTCSSSRPRRARTCAACSARRSQRMGIIPRSASGRCSTRAGASISTTIRTTGAG